MVEARAQQTMACSPEEFLEFVLDIERYAQVDDKLGPFDWSRREENRVEFKFRPTMPGIPGPAPKMVAEGVLTPGKRIDVGLLPPPNNKLWHRLITFNATFVCEPVEDGTLVTRTMTIEAKPAVRWLVEPILRRTLPKSVEAEVRDAKAYLERQNRGV
ncbi:SRPBCC family protein [Actinophytocola gossypii]|uniref:SRPBCC family protein n=1 Tax=Actinophytocola gossypii TaxID=2812003 RepID=A0ABT2J545_9PSEU|nr:SRPBCC family protein [Actinophytocola gossypii]MCT2582980.1 SRPBCC family protein [Actinophytocola gossypii]